MRRLYFNLMLKLNCWVVKRLQRSMKKRYPARQLELSKD